MTVNQDANLVNGWGIVSGPTTPMWVSDNGSGKSTVYDGTDALKLTVVVPDATGAGQGVPTGVVFNLGSRPTSNDFLVAGAGTAARFMWSTEDGAIAAWAGGPSATIPFVAPDGAVYTGLAMAGDGNAHFRIYAADSTTARSTSSIPTSRRRRSRAASSPKIPATFHPFNVMNIQGNLYVSYALCCEPGEDDEVAGPGLGFVDVFDADGNLLKRVGSRGKLNAPWGIAFGNGFQQQPATTLFFAAGPNGESQGVYGKIEAVSGGKDSADDDAQE